MRFTLRQLDVFLETARTGNISRAADYLSISQSAASSALKELERQYDIMLFDRLGKRLVLNDLGRAIRPRAEALRDQARELNQDLKQESALRHWHDRRRTESPGPLSPALAERRVGDHLRPGSSLGGQALAEG